MRWIIALFVTWFTDQTVATIERFFCSTRTMRLVTVGNSQFGNPHFGTGLTAKEIDRDSTSRGVSQLFVPPSGATRDVERGALSHVNDVWGKFLQHSDKSTIVTKRSPVNQKFCRFFRLIFGKPQPGIVDCKTLNDEYQVSGSSEHWNYLFRIDLVEFICLYQSTLFFSNLYDDFSSLLRIECIY